MDCWELAVFLAVKNLPINTTKPMFVFDANASEVFDASVMKGAVAKAPGHGLTFAVAVVCGSPWVPVGARPQRAAGEGVVPPPLKWQ